MGLLWNCTNAFSHVRLSHIKKFQIFLICHEKKNNCWNDHKNKNRHAKEHKSKKTDFFSSKLLKVSIRIMNDNNKQSLFDTDMLLHCIW